MPIFVRLLFAVGIGSLGLVQAAAAQKISVQVTGQNSHRPIAGALLTVLDERGSALKRLLANVLGRATIDVAPGRYRVKGEGIGFSTMTSDWVTVAGDQTARVTLMLREAPFVLKELTVQADRPCDKVDAYPLIAKVWEEARKGLMSTTLSTDNPPLLEQVKVVKKLGVNDDQQSIQADTVLTATKRPFLSADPDLLHQYGFIMRDPKAGVGHYEYFAPDAELMLSDQFLEDHCFALVPLKKETEDRFGVQFKPNKQRKRLPEVEGIIWLDPVTSELQTLEFRYVNFVMPRGARRVGGKITFNRIPTGEWIISHWSIRVPRWEDGAQVFGGYRETGGSARPIAVLKGTLLDSTTKAPIAGASIYTDDMIRTRTDAQGAFTLISRRGGTSKFSVDVPLLRSIGVQPLVREAAWPRVGEALELTVRVPMLSLIRTFGCPSMPDGSPLGMIFVEVRDSGTGRRRPVSAFTIQSGDSVIAKGSAVDGVFWGCSVPVGASFTVIAKTNGVEITHKATVPESKIAVVQLDGRPER